MTRCLVTGTVWTASPWEQQQTPWSLNRKPCNHRRRSGYQLQGYIHVCTYIPPPTHTHTCSKEENVLRMNTSVKLNELIVTKSHNSALVIVNLPGPPKNRGDEENCILACVSQCKCLHNICYMYICLYETGVVGVATSKGGCCILYTDDLLSPSFLIRGRK